jgi:sec-independent protein translocase protein TatB
MLDVAWPELMVIGAVALVAIGPKDLPKVMHGLGVWAGKARKMLHELHGAFDQLTYESEVAEKLKNQAATHEETVVQQERSDSPPPAGEVRGGVHQDTPPPT